MRCFPPRPTQLSPTRARSSGGEGDAGLRQAAQLLPRLASPALPHRDPLLGVCSQDPPPSLASFVDAEYFRTRSLLHSLACEVTGGAEAWLLVALDSHSAATVKIRLHSRRWYRRNHS
ncbi:hypothetical protein J1605_000723 [Eschrichtius robustus]|uniref:Uncharacterized protein n=1 Tax=Eschrichtius robustus TaxID=9764 RepID=A0AB34GPM9_ESCRO|nr:hypothetical protein J1605_000723 [Eschrichtius robustus]